MTGGWISNRVSGMRISAIKDMAMRSARVEGAASLTWGLPSFRTPEYIRRAVERELEADPEIGKYALPDGLPELRRLVAAERSAIGPDIDRPRIDPDDNVMITAGNMQGMNAVLHVLIDPGDEIIVTDPGFAPHFQQIRLCGGKPVFWQLDETAGWRLDLDALPRLITERTKGIVLVTPSNPTGKIFSESELRRIGEIARDASLLIILDNPYSHFLYENRDRFFDLATVAEFADHIAYLFTFSKTYAMSG
jgi:aspartate/methionine/tyrosine aminotransferase